MTKLVFGAGIALVNHWKLIKKYYNPIVCIDNDRSKWGKTLSMGLKCISMEDVAMYEQPEVLITVGDPYAIEAIKKQLEQNAIPYIVLADKLAEWGMKEPFPKHLEMLKNDKKRKIFLMNTPEHDNVGDHLIALSEMDFLHSRFADYSIYEVTDIEYSWYGCELKKYIQEDDIILITGGGFLGSLWLYNGEDNVRKILHEHSENKVLILPQTIYFEENERGRKETEKTIDNYSKSHNLTIILRDRKSYEIVSQMNSIAKKVELMPDMAYFYHNSNVSNVENVAEKKVLFCIRKDKESVMSEEMVNKIKELFVSRGYQIILTSMHSGKFGGLAEREEQVREKLSEIANAQVVVTDTLHCMISSALMGTPCFAFDNVSGKVRNVYKWVEPLPYIYMEQNVSNIEKLLDAEEMQKGEFLLENSEEYLERLEKMIRDDA